ncbi:MAG: hypothetical protein ACHQ4H_02450 [Ktedonobacterales bacterium]
MHGRQVRLGIFCVALVLASLGYVFAGTRLYQNYHAAYATYQLETGRCGALITWSPPSLLFTGLYVNQPQLLTLRYRAPAPERLRITVGIPQLTQDQTIEVMAGATLQDQSFKPALIDDHVLDGLVTAGQRMGAIHLRVEAGGAAVCDTTSPVTLLSRQWMHWYDAATGTDYSPYLAGWVTPHSAAITDLVGRVARWMASHPASYAGTLGLVGYSGQSGQRDVVNQVDAIFDTLQSVYHVYYAQDNVPFSQDATQRIKLPDDVLSSPYPAAMCVETTAIMASAVEALGMKPYFIIVPGHAFLGVALGPGSDAPFGYWETSDLNGGIDGNQALVHGDAEYTSYQAQGKVLRVIDVAQVRAQGIEPIE